MATIKGGVGFPNKYLCIMSRKAHPAVRAWLITGLVMVFIQILLGGITRLTGSGLSITEWSVIMGTLPPLNAADWQEAFAKYQQIDQYKLVNSNMTMGEFKYIFFWEWFHRLWARTMGFVFLLPLLFFWAKGIVKTPQVPRYGVLLILGGMAGLMGWVMVASGLEEDMVLVNPFKLMGHLLIACSIFMYLFRLILEDTLPKERSRFDQGMRRIITVFMVLVVVQIAFGGLVAGSKAALNCTTWPLMNGSFIPEGLGFETPFKDHIAQNNITLQFVHRMMAYGLLMLGVWLYWKSRLTLAQPVFHYYRHAMIVVLTLQVVLGILTVINSKGAVPVGLGVVHQFVAFFLLNILVGLHYLVKYRAISTSGIR
jgi:cytochrome c oxidase assembly protein subunit 15